MKETNDLEQSIENLRVVTTADTDQRILTDASAALTRASKAGRPAKAEDNLWIGRTIMKKHWTKFTAAAAVVIAVAILWVTVLNKSATPAYALEQTIQANHSVRTIHIKKFVPQTEQPDEVWAEFDESGKLRRCRMDQPQTADGPKFMVWEQDKAEIWLKAKNMHVIVHQELLAEQLRKAMEVVDPKLAVQNLHQLQAEGKVQIEITEAGRRNGPIKVTATFLKNSSHPEKRVVLLVDNTTKLVKEIEVYQLSKGDYEYESRLEIQDYNQAIGPEMFTLSVPDDAIRIDQTVEQIGLVQGNLTDEEIAIKVVRELLEALIAKNYAQASKLYQGLPPKVLQEHFGDKSFVRIISIGEPKSSKWNKLIVPCRYEVEADGKKSIVQADVYTQRVVGKPDRWTVDGGIK